MQVSNRTFGNSNANQIGAFIERPDRQLSPFGPLGLEKGLGGLSALARVGERLDTSHGEAKRPVDDYQTGRLAKQARQELAKDHPTSSHGNQGPSIAETLEKVFGVSGIKQFSATYSFDYAQTVEQSSSEKLTYSSSNSGLQRINYDYQESYRSVSKTAMAMSGTLTLDDGRAFAFSIDYSMERSIEQHTRLHYGMNDAVKSSSLVGNSLPHALSSPVEIVGSGRALNVMPTEIGNGSYEGIAEHDDNGNGYIDLNDSIWNLLNIGVGNKESTESLAEWRIAIINLIRLELPYISKEEETQPSAANDIARQAQDRMASSQAVQPINFLA
jgi:hypothetical protein